MSGTVLNNYAHIFDILIRLRQAVDHPYLVIYSDTQATSTASSAASSLAAERNQQFNSNNEDAEADVDDDLTCSICHEPTEDEVRAECGHAFCRSCLLDYISAVEALSPSATFSTATENVASSGQKSRATARSTGSSGSAGLRCPDCQRPLTADLHQQSRPLSQPSPAKRGGRRDLSESVWDASKKRKKSILDRVNLANFQSSTKLEALMEVRQEPIEIFYLY